MLSIQQKFQFEIWEISCAQWNGTFRLHRPNLSHRAFDYCSCKQDTEEQYWEPQFCQMERDISVRLTEMTRLVKVDHLQSCSRIFWSNQTKLVHSIWSTNWNFWNFGLNGKRLLRIISCAFFLKELFVRANRKSIFTGNYVTRGKIDWQFQIKVRI